MALFLKGEKMANIFTIVTFQKNKKVLSTNDKLLNNRPSRIVGFMHDKKKAIEIIEDNVGDLYEEGYYPYALVEEVPEGIYGIARNLPFEDRVTWFKWDKTEKAYKQIEKCPDDLDGVVNLSIG